MPIYTRFKFIPGLLLVACVPMRAFALDTSHITAVKLYPGTAIVERVADIAASSTHFTFSCLPARLDESSVEITASHGGQVGELSISTKPADPNSPCAGSELAKQIKTLQHQKDVLTVRLNALDDSHNFLKNMGASDGTKPNGGGNIAAAAQSVAKASEDIGAQRLDVQTQIDVLDQTLTPLLDEQKATQQNAGSYKTIGVDVASNGPTQLHLTYRISGPGWTPGYRATLNTGSGAIAIERLALVAQASGEDWTNAHITCFAGQPGRNLMPRKPSVWQVGIAPQFPPGTVHSLTAAAPAPPPPPIPRAAPLSNVPTPPLYDVSSFVGNYDTQFDISRPITVPSNGQKVSLSLGRYAASATTYVEITPANGSSAFLVAEMEAPEGIWLPGNMDLYRDDNYAGQSYFRPATEEKQSLSFGQDDLINLQILPQRSHQGTAGFLDQDGERRIEHRYLIESRHANPVSVHVLEPTPVSQDDKIKVQSQFNLTPDEKDWHGMPGVILWQLKLDPGKQQELVADYTINFPKDAQVSGLSR